tara:strand:- start:1715 stop:1972 length:258 start_codon:yes stop_codon:yes gene_type:complete
MVHLERIHEEIRVLNIKDETLLSFRVFVNFSKRIDLLHGIELGILPDRNKMTKEEVEEKKYLDKYFKTLKELFPRLYEKWYRRSI